MPRLLVHIATGPHDPTRLALGLLVARTALETGHDVDVFLAGDAVTALREQTREAAQGIGTGSVREHWEALVAGGAKLFGSGLSARARGVTSETVDLGPVQLAPPARLVELAFEADRVLTY